MRRQAATAGAVLVMALTACGGDDDGTASTAAGSDGSTEQAADAEPGDFCSNLEIVVTESAELMTALFAGDVDRARAVVEGPLPAATVAVETSAPAELAGDVSTVAGWTSELLGALEGADLDGGEGALADMVATDGAMDEAGDRISEYARAECGFDPETAMDEGIAMPESPEPPDPCTFVDGTVPASAAGVEVDTSRDNDTANVDLGVFAIRGCAYNRGAMVVSTVTFPGPVDEVVGTYVRSTEDQGGTATTDFDKGSLPDSTLITTANGFSTITVFEAPTPFSVGFSDVSDPATLVAAAESVLAATG